MAVTGKFRKIENWEIPSGDMARNAFQCENSYKSTLLT